MAHFREGGIRFQYPENWMLDKQESEGGWSVAVQSPETAFFLLSLDASLPPLEAVIATAADALRDEYPDLEIDESVDTVAGLPAVGYEGQFTSLDLTNTCWVRSFYSADGTVLAMWQLNDLELERMAPVLKAICASLRVEEE